MEACKVLYLSHNYSKLSPTALDTCFLSICKIISFSLGKFSLNILWLFLCLHFLSFLFLELLLFGGILDLLAWPTNFSFSPIFLHSIFFFSPLHLFALLSMRFPQVCLSDLLFNFSFLLSLFKFKDSLLFLTLFLTFILDRLQQSPGCNIHSDLFKKFSSSSSKLLLKCWPQSYTSEVVIIHLEILDCLIILKRRKETNIFWDIKKGYKSNLTCCLGRKEKKKFALKAEKEKKNE